MFGHKILITAGTLLLPLYSFASSFTYAEAEQHWLENKDTAAYQAYAAGFEAYSKAHRLDTNLRCQDLGTEPVTQYLIIQLGNSRKYSFVEDVVQSIDTPKSRCFIDSYKDVQVQRPPYLPFILQMQFK